MIWAWIVALAFAALAMVGWCKAIRNHRLEERRSDNAMELLNQYHISCETLLDYALEMDDRYSQSLADTGFARQHAALCEKALKTKVNEAQITISSLEFELAEARSHVGALPEQQYEVKRPRKRATKVAGDDTAIG